MSIMPALQIRCKIQLLEVFYQSNGQEGSQSAVWIQLYTSDRATVLMRKVFIGLPSPGKVWSLHVIYGQAELLA